jgi:CheY-like chemotaxis protein
MTAPTVHSVLVVDDDESLRELIAVILQEDGIRVVEAGDGAAAIQQLAAQRGQQAHFCALVLDLMMPGVDGLTVLRYLRDEAEPVPAIALSAGQTYVSEALAAGAAAALAKPFTLDALLALVRRYCPCTRL